MLAYRAASLKQASEFIAARSHYIELRLDHLINLYRAPEADYLITELRHAARDFQVESMRDTLLTAQSVSIQVAEGGAEMQAEQTYEIKAQDFIELRMGDSRIKLTPEKIILAAPTIHLN